MQTNGIDRPADKIVGWGITAIAFVLLVVTTVVEVNWGELILRFFQ